MPVFATLLDESYMVDGVLNSIGLTMEMDKGNHPHLFHLMISSVASLALSGSCSHTKAPRNDLYTHRTEPSAFRLLQICLLGSARLRRNDLKKIMVPEI